MIPQEFEYSAPTALEDALTLVATGAKPLAGGHSLVPLMKLRLASPEQLVDLRRVPGLNFIERRNGSLCIGAMTTHYEIETSAQLRAMCPLLAETAGHIGDVQVRNMGTIGGSVAHADPAADYPAALLALEGQVRLRSAGSDRTIPFDDFFLDTFTTALESGEIVFEAIVPAEEPGTGASYQKHAHPASGFAVVGVAARVRKAQGRVAMARVGITGISPKPFRAIQVERLIEGTGGTEEDIRRASREADSGVEVTTDLYAAEDYRRHLARVYTARALRTAIARAE